MQQGRDFFIDEIDPQSTSAVPRDVYILPDHSFAELFYFAAHGGKIVIFNVNLAHAIFTLQQANFRDDIFRAAVPHLHSGHILRATESAAIGTTTRNNQWSNWKAARKSAVRGGGVSPGIN